MTQILRLHLLGDVLIQRGEQPVSGLPSRAAEALLVYLACHDRPIAREKLAEIGDKEAMKQVKEEHFPATFDIKK